MGVPVKTQGVKIVHPTRRIIVATNVAETGITIETLKYVIDTGYNKSNEYDPIYRADMLITKPVTQSMYKQRRGRVGRKAPGFAFPLYTQDTFNKLQEDQFPDMIKKDTSLDLLSMIIMESDPEGESNEKPLIDLVSTKAVVSKGVRKDIREKIMQNMIAPSRDELSPFELKLCSADIDLFKLDLLDPPSADSIHSSLDRLYTAGAIYRNCTPTAIGVLMNKFRFIGLECIRMILAGYAWDVAIIDLITIAAFCSVRQDLKMNPRDLERLQIKINPEPEPDQLVYACDFIETLISWYRYQDVCSKFLFDNATETPEEWCLRNGLKFGFFNEVAAAREDIILSISGMGLNPYALFDKSYLARTDLDMDDWVSGIKQCLFEGFKSNVCMWNPIAKAYETRYGRVRTTVDKEFIANRIDLAKYGGQNPKFLLYDSLGFRQDTQTNEYKPTLKYVSVLDGFIAIDVDYDA